jgi:dTDP-4-amino-4,6-dideoxygalactose transaminase
MKIPFFKPFLTGQELNKVEESINSLHWSGDGPFSNKCAALLGAITDRPVYLVPSGTAGLELSLMALNLQPGDEVIMPSYGFPSIANAAVQMGLVPIFIDVRNDTLNLDETLIESALSEKTRAILVIHYAGVSADMDAINVIAKKNGLWVIEDAAQGVNAFLHGKPLGTLGDLGIYSFHQTKNFSSGEGGAVIVNNMRFQEGIDIHRQKGTNRSQFLHGKIDKYSWIDRGSNYLLSNILAAFLLAQLEQIKATTDMRRKLFNRYYEGLKSYSKGRFQLPVIPPGCEPNYHLFFIILDSEIILKQLMGWLSEKGVESTTHFVPLHSSIAGRQYGVVRSKMEVTDRSGACLLRLPFFTQMSNEEVDYVIDSLKSFFKI